MTTKLTTHQAIASGMLMAITSDPENRAAFEEIVKRAKGVNGLEQPAYEVELRVNGVPLDWNVFERIVAAEYDRWLSHAARDLILAELEAIQKHTHPIEDDLRHLAQACKVKVQRIYKIEPDEEDLR